MLINEVTIHETFENLLPGDEEKKAHYAEKIHAMLVASYAGSGGLKGGGTQTPEQLIHEIPMWKIFRRGTDIKAVVLYKDKGGRKIVAGGTDGTPAGIKGLAQMMKDDALRGRAFAEISGKMLAFMQRTLGAEGLQSISIPVEQVIAHLNKFGKEIHPVNEFEYERKLRSGDVEKKLMIGTLGNTIR